MATAKKLPSGSWRIRVFDYEEEILMPDGTRKVKKHYRSFTCADPGKAGKRRVEAEATAWAAQKERRSDKSRYTVGMALDAYISSKAAVLSPSTIRGYQSMRGNQFHDLEQISLDRLTTDTIQQWISSISLTHSAKYTKNIHGLLTATLKQYAPHLDLRPSLPTVITPELYVPSDDDVQKLLTYTAGTDLEIAIMLAAFGTLRRGEVCALTSEDIQGDVVGNQTEY